MFIVSKFMLTVSYNGNPIIDFVYRLKNTREKTSKRIYVYCSSINDTIIYD